MFCYESAGKSYLLSRIIIFLCRLLDRVDKQRTIRIFIASLTNVAVDNILLKLLRAGFTDFARVGSVRSIAKPILPHTLYSSNSGSGKQRSNKSIEDQALADLKKMRHQLLQRLQDTDLGANKHYHFLNRGDEDENIDQLRRDYAILNKEIAEMDSSRRRSRASKLSKVRVVGSTCAATNFDILSLKKSQFSIVLLDECSQMVEPCSLQPLIFGCERLLAVGGSIFDFGNASSTIISIPRTDNSV